MSENGGYQEDVKDLRLHGASGETCQGLYVTERWPRN